MRQKEYISDKIKSGDEIKNITKDSHQKGFKIGLCLGSFDLLHPGHMTHLNSAKRKCDILIVGITADKFLENKKGIGRPIYQDYLRLYSVSQLLPVDYVFLSEYKTAVESILNISPDLYIKGIDYKDSDDSNLELERQAIESVNGKIIYTETDKLSTTKIIEYIKCKIK